MFGPFFGLSEFLMEPKQRRALEEARREALEQWLATAEPWTPKTPWRKKLALQATSWPSWSLFDVEPTNHNDVNDEDRPEGKFVTSPTGAFLYCEKILRRGVSLDLLQGNRRGSVVFDGPVVVPALHAERSAGWNVEPWMSHTPMEIVTQRPGLRLARGHVVVAGLGLGWNLVQVLAKRTVKRVTLVEISQELVDWILPRVMDKAKLMLGEKLPPLDVVVGDAHEVLKDYKADVALVDIFKRYGGNYLSPAPRNIPTVWCWGATDVTSGRGF